MDVELTRGTTLLCQGERRRWAPLIDCGLVRMHFVRRDGREFNKNFFLSSSGTALRAGWPDDPTDQQAAGREESPSARRQSAPLLGRDTSRLRLPQPTAMKLAQSQSSQA